MGGYTADFALVCEGVTDHAVLKNILLGYFKGQPRAARITQRQPDSDATGEAVWRQFGNWENVFRYLREGFHRDALEFAEYLVVQVDTNDSEHPNFGVAQQEGGQPLAPGTMAGRVAAKLREIIGPEDCATYGARLIFAICVRDIECWLLPLWETGSKVAKTTGCLQALNAALARNNEQTINPADKKVPPYDNASRNYRNRVTLLDGRTEESEPCRLYRGTEQAIHRPPGGCVIGNGCHRQPAGLRLRHMTATIDPQITMGELVSRFPGAQRALFRSYHVGGCSSCGFKPGETLAEVCTRNENLPVDEVVQTILSAHDADQRMQISPGEAAELVKAGKARLIDVRSQEEWDSVHIEGSTFFTQELMHSLGGLPKDELLIFVCHHGVRSLDAAAYFAGHGLENVRTLRGGIDAWSCEVDPNLPRYEVE